MKRIKEKAIGCLAVLKTKLTSINYDPKKVSMGYAFGIFLASTPFIGIKVFIAILFTSVFKWSKVAAIIGVFHINALTGPLFYGLSFLVGKKVLGAQIEFSFSGTINLKTLFEIFQGNIAIFYSLLLGGFILGIPMSIGAYWLSMHLTSHRLPNNYSPNPSHT
jgi:uncharacterized protein (DUF2062 family)